MFEGIITGVLNRVLGDFIEGIKADQLSISLLSGDVELKNLSIKPTILDSMPLPFKIRYGKVGRIFVDVPVTSILSSPLKIEISDIFMLVNPKEVNEWNEDVIKKAFIEGVQSQLETLEDTFKAQLEIQNAEPGMAGNMINKIIDNIQIDIKNICFRFEDSISNEKTPYALGIHLEAIQLYTCNEDWERDFVSGEDISLKMAKITNFELYLNYCGKGDEDDSVNFGEFEEDMDLAEVVQDQLERSRRNRNLIEKFCIEARVRLNKNPKKNSKPMVDVNVVIGGKFVEGRNELVDSEEGIGFFKLQKQQMNCILKYLDYSTNYTKFQTGVEKEYLEKRLNSEHKKKYKEIYEEFKKAEGYLHGRKNKSLAKKFKKKLSELEKDYSYEVISKIRTKVISLGTFETRKANKRREIDAEIRNFENSKRQGLLGRVFASKSEEELKQDQMEIDKFVKKKEKEFSKFTKDDEAMLHAGSLLDLNNLFGDMAEDYFQFEFSVDLKEIGVMLYGYQDNPRQRICVIKTGGISANAKIGKICQQITLKLGYLEVKDEIDPYARFKYLTQTVMDEGYEENHFILLNIDSNSKRQQGSLRITFETRAKQYVITNFILIDALQKFFSDESVDISYYIQIASDQTKKFLEQGAEYMDTLQDQAQADTEYKGIDARIRLQTPILIIPENISQNDRDKEAVVLNLGMFKGSSKCQILDKLVDYTKENDPEKLYDRYRLEFEGLQLTMVKDLEVLQDWERCAERIDIIEEIKLTLKAKRCICPAHPNQPKVILDCKVNKIKINFSDYIMINLFQTLETLQDSIDPFLSLEEKLGGKVSNNEESKRSMSYSEFGEGESSSEELEISRESLQESDSKESQRSEESEKAKLPARYSEDLSHPSPVGSSSKSPMESGEDLYSPSELDESEEYKEGGSVSEESDPSNTPNPDESSGLISRESSGQPESSSYATARDVLIEDSKVPESSTTYKSFSESFDGTIQRSDLSTPESSEEEESSSPPSSPLRGMFNRDRLEKESLLASKMSNPKTHIGNISMVKESPQDDSAPRNIMNRLLSNSLRSAEERGKVTMQATLCFQRVTISVSEQFSTETERINRNKHRIEKKRKLEKIDFLELTLEEGGLMIELSVNYSQANFTTVNANIKRLFAQDIQIQENGEKLIPHPYDLIICSPLIEQALEEEEDYEESSTDMKQLRVMYIQKGDRIDLNFVLTNMRFTIAPPTIEQFVKFKVKIDELKKDSIQKEINRKKKLEELEKKLEGPSENINESEELSQYGRALPRRIGSIQGSGQTPKRIFEEKQAQLKEEEKQHAADLEKKESIKGNIETRVFKVSTNISGKVEGVEIWTPLDATDKDSRVLSFSLGANVKMRMVSEMITRFDKIK